MYVELGNVAAVQHDRAGQARALPGQRTTRFDFPAEFTVTDALRTITTSWPTMCAANDKGEIAGPAWIETNSRTLRTQLCKRYGLDTKKAKRPGNWGAERS